MKFLPEESVLEAAHGTKYPMAEQNAEGHDKAKSKQECPPAVSAEGKYRIEQGLCRGPTHDQTGNWICQRNHQEKQRQEQRINPQLEGKADLLLPVDELTLPTSVVTHLFAPRYTFPYLPRSEQSGGDPTGRGSASLTEHEPHKAGWRHCVECSQSEA